jgi:hypothetical protein
MAFFTPSCLISEIRGSVGNQTFSRNAHGNIVKEKLVQTNPDTAKQQAVRTVMSDAVEAWQLLTDSERSEWSRFARLFPRRNSLGKQFYLPGYHQFVSCYLNRINSFQAGNPQPVRPPAFPIITSISVTNNGITTVTNFQTGNINAGFDISFYITEQHLGNIKSLNPSNLRHWWSFDVSASRNVTTNLEYSTVFGEDYIFSDDYSIFQGYKFVHLASGIASKMYYFGYQSLFAGSVYPLS